MDETTRILIRARQRLTDRRHWTKGTTARGARGRMAHPLSPEAVRWCAIGALHVECDSMAMDGRFREAVGRLEAVIDAPGCDSIALLNDTLGHEAVLEMFDAAIRAK